MLNTWVLKGFFHWGPIVDFSRWCPKPFLQGVNCIEILFYMKISNFKIRLGPPTPFSGAHGWMPARRCQKAYWLPVSLTINTLGTGSRIYTWEKLSTGYCTTYIYLLIKNPGFMTLGANTMCHFCDSSVFWKLGYHLSLWIPWLAF